MMSSLWKKATSPNVVEEAARTVMLKHALTAELGRAVRELQLNFIAKNEAIGTGEEAESLCACLEATFIHGLKGNIARRITNAFSPNSDRMPDPDFWPVIMVYSHKQVFTHISKLSEISTDIGRCRAWLRLALNDGLLKSYIDSLLKDKSTLSSYYREASYFRDSEQPPIMMQFLEGLGIFQFCLPYNYSELNFWSSETLLLAGLWSAPESPEPVMPAEDAVKSLFEKPKKTSSVIKTKRGKRQAPPLSSSLASADVGSEELNSSYSENTSVDDGLSTTVSECGFVLDKSASIELLDQENAKEKLSRENELTKSAEFLQKNLESSSPQSVPGFEHMFIGTETNLPCTDETYGNSLLFKGGWSSSFDPECQEENISMSQSDSMLDSQSYDSLFQSYTRNQQAIHVLAGTPDINCSYLPPSQPDTVDDMKIQTENAQSSNLSPVRSPEDFTDLSEFEVVSRKCTFNAKDMDEQTQNFLKMFDQICSEKGLDYQNYKCNGCQCHIGMIYGMPRICTYDGFNYCCDCHQGEEYYIPSRILYNWDFRKHSLSVAAKSFCQRIQEEPLIDIRKQNPQLYSVVNELVELQLLRTQLSFLRSYLFTCREDVAEQLRKMIWPREYLYEHIHLYSLVDLLQVPNNTLAQLLQRAISFAKKHVIKCTLCSQKGFICEICRSSKIIYPFETDTFHCEECLAVYHLACMENSKPCPKCQRRRKRSEKAV